MILRTFLMLGVGAAVVCAAPSFAAESSATPSTKTATAQTASATAAQSVATLETGTPQTETPVVKKPAAKKVKKVAKKKKKNPPVEEVKKEEPKGFFSRLFSADGNKPDAPAKPKATVKQAKATAKVKEQPKPVEPEEPLPEIALTGNNGELRSEKKEKPDLFSALFGGSKTELLEETRALDRVLEKKQGKKKFKVKPEYVPQEVEFSGYDPGTIVIDTRSRFLYLVEDRSTARRYAIAVGREGLLFTGKATVGDKQEWPRWIPTKEMQEREPKHYGQYKDGMPGGPENPLGARAMYLFQGKLDTHIRIHGTNQPQSIGSAASNGCFRMINDHVIDLYNRVKLGTPVVVL